MGTRSNSLQCCGGKESNAARSRSTSAGSSTQAGARSSEHESSDMDAQGLRTTILASTETAMMAPPGLEDLASPPTLEAKGLEQCLLSGIRAPPGLEDVAPAGIAATLLQTPVLRSSIAPSLQGMPPHMPLSFPPPISMSTPSFPLVPLASRFLPPPPLQLPALSATLMAPLLPQPPAQPPALPVHMGATATFFSPLLLPPAMTPQKQFLPAPPSQPPALNALTQAPQLLPPPPHASALMPLRTVLNAEIQAPPAHAPTLGEDLQPPSIPPPPSQAPALHLDGTPSLPSSGSADHSLGTCKPCAFLHAKGCTKGSDCSYCHLCGPGEKKRRMKEKRQLLRSAGY